jgi:hypothetical protein
MKFNPIPPGSAKTNHIYRSVLIFLYFKIRTVKDQFDDAIAYYDYEVPGLGNAFLTAVLKALERLEENAIRRTYP